MRIPRPRLFKVTHIRQRKDRMEMKLKLTRLGYVVYFVPAVFYAAWKWVKELIYGRKKAC